MDDQKSAKLGPHADTRNRGDDKAQSETKDSQESVTLNSRKALTELFVYQKQRLERLNKVQRILGVTLPEHAKSLEAILEIGKCLVKIELGKVKWPTPRLR